MSQHMNAWVYSAPLGPALGIMASPRTPEIHGGSLHTSLHLSVSPLASSMIAVSSSLPLPVRYLYFFDTDHCDIDLDNRGDIVVNIPVYL